MPSSVVLDTATFHRRLRALQTHWKSNPAEYSDAEVLIIAAGTAPEETMYSKTGALHSWLLGWSFTDTLIAIFADRVVFLASNTKANILNQLASNSDGGRVHAPVEIIRRGKGDCTAEINTFLDAVKTAHVGAGSCRAGMVLKDMEQDGAFAQQWLARARAPETATAITFVDMTASIATVLAVKDDSEQKLVRVAAKVSSAVMNHFFIDRMQSVIDEQLSVTHDALSHEIEGCIEGDNCRKKLRLASDVVVENLDWCYQPIVQSGGVYDLRRFSPPNADPLTEGVIVASMGVRYFSYCSNIARTFLIDPEPKVETNYQFLEEVFEHLLSKLVDGAKTDEVYNSVNMFVSKLRPELAPHLTKNVGFGMGIEFRESAYLLGAKTSREIKAGMIMHASVGFSNLENTETKDPKRKVYALLISDTVRVTNAAPTVLTESNRALADISYKLKDDDAEVSKSHIASKKKARAQVSPLKPRRNKDNREADVSNEVKRKQHQKQLARRIQEAGISRFADDSEGSTPLTKKEQFQRYESYKMEGKLPRAISECKILVDARAQSIILPIFGQAVPFHMNTLRNVTRNEEGEYTYLRFNFITPPGQGKAAAALFEDPRATFVRALTFRSTDALRFTEISKQVNDLKREIAKREAERKEMADLVEQDRLIEIKGKRPARLQEVFARPQLEGKRSAGDLEIHANGVRYQSLGRSEQTIDILYNNVKHLFFQPCDHELVIILHFHLKHPIMVGKKKTQDVQFFREVTDAQADETGNRKRRHMYGDEDELAMEQEERRRRRALNQEFSQFAERIRESSKGHVEADLPVRELGFMGVPGRQLVLMQPTTDCLVHLTEVPTTVVTLSEVELVHLERVQFGLNNFDMVFVFKDFKKAPVHINTIPMEKLEDVKDWLDTSDVVFSEGQVNLNWNQIMKTVNEDPGAFFREGGWSFLVSDSEDEGAGSDASDSVSEFDAGSDAEEGPSSSDYTSEDDDDGSASMSGSESEGYGSASSGNETGEDWDELDRKAAAADEKRRQRESYSDDEEETGRGRKKGRR
ncbi:hypothetical protein CXG81DRAFT_14380 [Caulochytrium protostelioides]|uniref:FACT complex subunit n=1 Tax=Caulochytrium protostelioides TaxID=1555241 RepID=A0A4P9X3C6_9FUNG|nr:putative SPT16-general chromatin factor [Caulochytrium protostelioides]RKO99523.1 hypothetical protein CXG81DRAFT_14380 [Caulochytrium protostelioides]|eukprot:RKO99523.1 hypothetical protein CXG81DRAFT_14380 [Caulochytrium protostelioides]